MLAAAARKARSLSVVQQVDGMTSNTVLAERRWRWQNSWIEKFCISEMSHLKQPTPCGNDGGKSTLRETSISNQHWDMTVLLARCKCPCGSNEEQSRHEIDSNATVTSASLATRISLHNKQNKKRSWLFQQQLARRRHGYSSNSWNKVHTNASFISFTNQQVRIQTSWVPEQQQQN